MIRKSKIPNLSLICVYNNRHVLKKCLINSICQQDIKIRCILINNTKNKYGSAAAAFNANIDKYKSKYLIFAHQDVIFPSPKTLSLILKYAESLRVPFIAGFAGIKERNKIITNVFHGTPPVRAGVDKLNRIVGVQTIDECCFVIPKDVISFLKYDEKVCTDWHLYAVEYCLSLLKTGGYVFLFPVYIYHKSRGLNFSYKYYVDLFRVVMKHKANNKEIHTTIGSWPTSIVGLVYRMAKNCIAYYKIKSKSEWP